MKSNRNIEFNNEGIIWIYLKAILVACIFVILVFVFMALVITYTNVSESIIPMASSIVMIISCLICGLYTGVKQKRKGWLKGSLAGFIYAFLIIIMSWVFIKDFTIGTNVLLKSLIGIVAGGIGGMIGVNLK
ncbi:TIGR04086 family membrane protein [Crassaminicella thermophila]|uniref:TIGR04086 family membrane protein n=1 Tax=Crassaminicella thermophila TaxID=2599308 RepID=A0A5C0SEA7_CRATE|nr:TIGR04086 family membrane protein [Crassaminicella thermophila]QEK12067.1 TIGR04086 family membrane protein [Crassaminicella thermophila]